MTEQADAAAERSAHVTRGSTAPAIVSPVMTAWMPDSQRAALWLARMVSRLERPGYLTWTSAKAICGGWELAVWIARKPGA